MMTPSQKLASARAILLDVASSEDCKWCRSHVKLVADAVGDLEEMSKLSEAAMKNPAVLKTYRRLGERAEELHILAFISRIARLVHSLKR